MNFDLLKKANEVIPSVPYLVNVCSLRLRELYAEKDMKFMVKPQPGDEDIDVVLREIIEHKLSYEEDKEKLEEYQRRSSGNF